MEAEIEHLFWMFKETILEERNIEEVKEKLS
jgi:hypothetical protein